MKIKNAVLKKKEDKLHRQNQNSEVILLIIPSFLGTASWEQSRLLGQGNSPWCVYLMDFLMGEIVTKHNTGYDLKISRVI